MTGCVPAGPVPLATAAHLHVVGQPVAVRTVETAQLVVWVQAVALHGDRQAFARLFTYYAPRIKAYLMRGGCDECQAEELAQESLLVLWRKAAYFDAAQASVGTWLFAVARNLRIDRFRSTGTGEVPYDEAALQAVADDTPQPDEHLHLAQLCERMLAALQQMPAAQARVLRMCYFEGQPHTRIAGTLDVPLGTVKSRMRAALAFLRRALQDGTTAP